MSPGTDAAGAGRAPFHFADRLLMAVATKDAPVVVGLDPRLDDLPQFVQAVAAGQATEDAVRAAIVAFHERVVRGVADRVPAVKLQSAFYEQYGVGGMRAMVDTIAMARSAGLVVLVDAKRNDIASTAEAYATAFLGGATAFGRPVASFEADAVTVSPYLGRDSLEPFVAACAEHGKGTFVLVRTSNPGGGDVQALATATALATADGGQGSTVAAAVARLVTDLGAGLLGTSEFSSVGAVVGATCAPEAEALRELMPHAVFLVPGYGAQGGTAADAAACFDAAGRGAIVNASRSLTYSFGDRAISESAFDSHVTTRTDEMVAELRDALAARRAATLAMPATTGAVPGSSGP